MKMSDEGISLIKFFEGVRLNAYKDSVGIPTIAYGCITYPDGRKVQMGDCCTDEEAESYLRHDMDRFIKGVAKRTEGIALTQNQFDALVSFSYNLGLGSLDKSTLLKKVKANPQDETIYKYTTDANGPVPDSCEFLKWCKGGGKVIKGLVTRRAKEADLYAKLLNQ